MVGGWWFVVGGLKTENYRLNLKQVLSFKNYV